MKNQDSDKEYSEKVNIKNNWKIRNDANKIDNEINHNIGDKIDNEGDEQGGKEMIQEIELLILSYGFQRELDHQMTYRNLLVDWVPSRIFKKFSPKWENSIIITFNSESPATAKDFAETPSVRIKVQSFSMYIT
ncbi:3760_t:CDS:2 [Funneliformis geosporum]|nr:3760_t:CDS:2 [Funneliformis geosporum]